MELRNSARRASKKRGERTLNVANVNNVGLPRFLALPCAPAPLAVALPLSPSLPRLSARPPASASRTALLRHFQHSSTLLHSYLQRKDDDDLEEAERAREERKEAGVVAVFVVRGAAAVL